MAMSSSLLTTTPGSGNRFARFNEDDHSAPIWIASILSLIFAYLILSIRLGYVKWNNHGFDDFFLAIGHVSPAMSLGNDHITNKQKLFGLGMSIALFVSLRNGLGKDLKLLIEADTSRMNHVRISIQYSRHNALSIFISS